MKQRVLTVVALSLALFLPYIAFAARLSDAVGVGLRIIQDLIIVVIGAALLVFLWGVLKYVVATDDAGKDKGRMYMLWGIIGLFVMVSVWGLVFLLRTSFGLQGTDQTPEAPRVEVPSGGESGGVQNIQGAVARIMSVIEAISPVLLGLGCLLFLWGVFQYVRTENAKDKGKAASYIAWGIGLLFVLSSVWGLVYMIGQTIGINTQRGTRLEGSTPVQIQSLIKK